jgi:hypothetical protein
VATPARALIPLHDEPVSRDDAALAEPAAVQDSDAVPAAFVEEWGAEEADTLTAVESTWVEAGAADDGAHAPQEDTAKESDMQPAAESEYLQAQPAADSNQDSELIFSDVAFDHPEELDTAFNQHEKVARPQDEAAVVPPELDRDRSPIGQPAAQDVREEVSNMTPDVDDQPKSKKKSRKQKKPKHSGEQADWAHGMQPQCSESTGQEEGSAESDAAVAIDDRISASSGSGSPIDKLRKPSRPERPEWVSPMEADGSASCVAASQPQDASATCEGAAADQEGESCLQHDGAGDAAGACLLQSREAASPDPAPVRVMLLNFASVRMCFHVCVGSAVRLDWCMLCDLDCLHDATLHLGKRGSGFLCSSECVLMPARSVWSGAEEQRLQAWPFSGAAEELHSRTGKDSRLRRCAGQQSASQVLCQPRW